MRVPVLDASSDEKLEEWLGVGSDHAWVTQLASTSDSSMELGWGHARVVNSGGSWAALLAADLVRARAEMKAENLAG